MGFLFVKIVQERLHVRHSSHELGQFLGDAVYLVLCIPCFEIATVMGDGGLNSMSAVTGLDPLAVALALNEGKRSTASSISFLG